jgi:hypothetical protein
MDDKIPDRILASARTVLVLLGDGTRDAAA